MKSIAIALSLTVLAGSALAAESAGTRAGATAPAAVETVSMIVKDLIPFDGGVVIKPEGGGKALILNEASNNKVFTAAKMQKLQKAQEDHTTIKFQVSGNQVVDILD